jgi:type I restriction enzyme, S subunit
MAKKKESLSFEERLEKAIVPEGERPYKVPYNWVWTRLGEVTDIVGGGTPSSTVPEYYENGNIPWISPVDLSGYTEKYISNGKKNITELGLEKSSAKLMPKDTVLLSSRAPIGYVAIANNKLCTNQGFKSFLPSKAFIPSFLYWYLKHSKELLESYASGTTFLELSGSKARLVEFPLPPLAEQQRIVERIESLFPKLDEAKEKVQTSLDSFKYRKAAILHKAFTGELTQAWREENGVSLDSWEEKSLGDIILIGPQNGLYKAKQFYGSGTMIIRIDTFYDGCINPWDTLKLLQLTDEELELYRVNNGDIVINRVNSMPYLGKSALVRNLSGDCVFESNMMRITVDRKRVDVEFIISYLSSAIGLKELRKNAKQAVNQASINQQDVKSVQVILPKLEEQTEIIRILDGIFEKEKKAKDLVDIIEKIDLMKKAILARAFRGELGTNDPEEESAMELLKEILSKEEKKEIKPAKKAIVIPNSILKQFKTDLEEQIYRFILENQYATLKQILQGVPSSKQLDAMKTFAVLRKKKLIDAKNDFIFTK